MPEPTVREIYNTFSKAERDALGKLVSLMLTMTPEQRTVTLFLINESMKGL
jgi:hypothetical protein